MCLELWGAATDCIKGVFACLCCLLCGGPILLIVGIVFLVNGSNRAENIAKYNGAVSAYQPTIGEIKVSWNGGTIGMQSVSVVVEGVDVKGNTDGVQAATSAKAVATVSNPSSVVSYNVNSVKAFSVPVMRSKSGSATAYCDSSTCYSYDMQKYCQIKYGGTWSGPSSACSRGSCGVCAYALNLKTQCAVARKASNGMFEQDMSFGSCYYPFSSSSNQYDSNRYSSVVFELRASDDPFIALQRLTKGSLDFGLTATMVRGTSAALIIVGALMIVATIVAGVLVVKCCMNRNNQNATVADTNQNYPGQVQPGYQGQDGTCGPAPGYPVQPGGGYYGQPQPGTYWQAQPGSYGQPPGGVYGHPSGYPNQYPPGGTGGGYQGGTYGAPYPQNAV